MLGTFIAILSIVHYLGISNPLEMLKTAAGTGLNLLKSMLQMA